MSERVAENASSYLFTGGIIKNLKYPTANVESSVKLNKYPIKFDNQKQVYSQFI
jgi:hypothetical protein